MNTEANAIPGPAVESPATALADIPATRRLYWAVRREVWENRSIYLAPLAVAAVILVGFLISTVRLPAKMRAASALDPMQQHHLLAQPYLFAAGVMMLTTLAVGVFYSLDALYGERRDRSVLFWKSLPVSDLTTVLSKAITPVVILPLVTFAITVGTQWIMLLVSTGLWYAPIYGWLLLVSAWARRAPFLWAGLPLLAIGVVEKIAFNTSHFGALLADRMIGGPGGDSFMAGSLSMDPLMHFTPGAFLISPGLWIGLAVAAVFLAAAVRLRRYRDPI
jgi:ABC-2 type transport system permease protein